ncbi:hypothetical protein [Labrenzia sp. DG1229]|uniref:hypothetical protein n=1 Tax=Labrenzia sp. DG1229 TaxID=681847 RepID=UPI00049085DE|nr:hypothetical protein [Labrenzia sp. DG1229]
MTSISNRLAKLEKRIIGDDGRPSHFILLTVGRQSKDEIDRFLSDQEYDVDDDTMLIKLCAVEPSPNGPVDSDIPLEIISSSLETSHA